MPDAVQAYVVSAFSKDGRGGNRAGIVLESAGLNASQKCAIAAQLGYSETVFLSESLRADYQLEYFTPVEEVSLCGHATIAAFSLLCLQKRIQPGEYTIETKAGILRIRAGEDGCIFMEQNLPDYGQILPPEALDRCMDSACISDALPVQIVSTGLRDILLPVRSVDAF